MKIKFADDFKGDKLEGQIGDKTFYFSNGGTPFDVSEELGQYLLNLGYFVICDDEAAKTAELPQTPAPRKN